MKRSKQLKHNSMQRKKSQATGALSPAEVAQLTSGRITGVEIAALCGISRQRACQLLRQGHTPIEIVQERRGLHRDKPPVNGTNANSIETRSLAELQRAKLAASVEHLHLDLAERKGEMIDYAKVDFIVQHVAVQNAVAVKELLALPSLFREQCDGRDGAEIESLLTAELTRVLEKLAYDNRHALGLLKNGGDDR